MKLSIIIPVYNEAATIRALLMRVVRSLNRLHQDDLITGWEIVVVNDGSSDKTSTIIADTLGEFTTDNTIQTCAPLCVLSAHGSPKPTTTSHCGGILKSHNLIQYIHQTNAGKGSALRTGLSQANGDVLVTQDADLEYNPKYYAALIQPIEHKNAEVVYGSRLGHLPLNWKTLSNIKLPLHFLSNKWLSGLTTILYGQRLTDMETGYKVLSRRAYESILLTADGFEIEVELTAKLIKAGFTIVEVPITTNPRGYDEGKKIGFRDGVLAIISLFRYWWNNYHLAWLGVILATLILRLWHFGDRYQLNSQTVRALLQARNATPTSIWSQLVGLVDTLPGGHEIVWLVLALTSVVTVVLVMHLGRILCGRWGSLVAGILAAVSLASIELALSGLPASLVPLITTLALLEVITSVRRRQLVSLLLVGVLGVCLIAILIKGPYLGTNSDFQLVSPQEFTANLLIVVPRFWARVVGGGTIWAYGLILTIVGLIVCQMLKWRLQPEVFWSAITLLSSFLLVSLFVPQLRYTQLSFTLPFIWLLTAWALSQLQKWDVLLGYSTWGMIFVSSFLMLLAQGPSSNTRSSLENIVYYLEESRGREEVAIYDYQAQNSYCSLGLRLLLSDRGLLNPTGYPLGICQGSDCTTVSSIIFRQTVGSTECYIIDLGKVEQEIDVSIPRH